MTGFGPFEPSDDSAYRQIGYVQVVVAKFDELKQKLRDVGKEPPNVAPLNSSKDPIVPIPTPSSVTHPDVVPQHHQSDDIDAVKNLRDYLEEIKEVAEKRLETVERLSSLTDEELSTAYEEFFTKDIASLLSSESRGSVQQVQQVLCPALQKEAEDVENAMLEQVLESVGSLVGDSVSLEEVRRMHDIVRFVERYHGDLEVSGSVPPIQGLDAPAQAPAIWETSHVPEGPELPKTVKKVLVPGPTKVDIGV